MPAFALTYDEIVTQLQRFCTRVNATQNFTPQIPLFVNFAEIKCARDAKLLLAKIFVTGTLTLDNPTVQKPADWRETVSINIGTGTNNNTAVFLKPRGYEFCRLYWPDNTETAQPEYYADSDYHFFYLAPTPDFAYPFQLVYFAQPAYLSDENQTNRLTDLAPDLLFAACMIEANRFLKNTDELAKWEDIYMKELLSVTSEDSDRQQDQTQQRGRGA